MIELSDARAQSKRLCDLRRHGRAGTTLFRQANATQDFDAARVVTIAAACKRYGTAVGDLNTRTDTGLGWCRAGEEELSAQRVAERRTRPGTTQAAVWRLGSRRRAQTRVFRDQGTSGPLEIEST